jgi:hypothetical protein
VAAAAPSLLIYPANGATGIPDGNFTLEVTGPPNPISLQNASTVVVSNVPASAPFTGAPLSGYEYQIPALQAETTYTVIALTSRGGCYDPNKVSSTVPAPIGSFTTK